MIEAESHFFHALPQLRHVRVDKVGPPLVLLHL